MGVDLSSKTNRARLKEQRNPYYQKLGQGCFLGFRPGSNTWSARFRDGAGNQHFQTFLDPAPTDFDAAKKLAEAWFATMGGTDAIAAPTRDTVEAALLAYVAELKAQNRPGAAAEARRRFVTLGLVEPEQDPAPAIARDPFADVRLEKATREDFRAWGARVRAGREWRTQKCHFRTMAQALKVQRNHKTKGLGYPETWIFASRLSGTVEAALRAHFADLRRQGRKGKADQAEIWMRTTVLGDAAPRFDPVPRDPLADVRLEKMTRKQFKEWRERVLKGGREGPREPRTVNRYVRAVAAALSLARSECGHVGNPDTWTLPELVDDVEDGENTAVFLTPKQRVGFLAAMRPDAAQFCHALELTGARPHELMNARVRDLDPMAGTVRLSHRKGRNGTLRTRHTRLCPKGREHFGAAAAGKSPDDFLFRDRAGRPWTNKNLGNCVRDARERYNEKAVQAAANGARGAVPLFDVAEPLPAGTGAYAFRHARIAELLQWGNVDATTVGVQTGTSAVMIRATYYKFIRGALDERLEAMNAKIAAEIHAA